jgi:hypothetical protein
MPRAAPEMARRAFGGAKVCSATSMSFKRHLNVVVQIWVLKVAGLVLKAHNLNMKQISAKDVLFSQSEIEKLKNWVPSDFRFGSWSSCFYCGTSPTDQEHVIPFSMLTLQKRTDASANFGPRTPACHECNLILSNFFFDSLSERCEYANKRLRRRYSKLLHMETWQQWELDEVKGKLRGYVLSKQAERGIAVDRVSWQFKEEFTKLFEEAYQSAKSEFPGNEEFQNFMKPKWL